MVRLDECAEVFPGYSVRGRMVHDPSGTHQLILTRHLTDGEPYVYTSSHEFRTTPHTGPSLDQLRPNDVLFMSRGTANRAWVVATLPPRAIAPVSFYILRPRADVDGGYLAWNLNQSPTQAAIDAIRTGAGAPLVQRDAFHALSIALPVLGRQREIASLGVLWTQEERVRESLAETARREHLALGATIINQLRNDHG